MVLAPMSGFASCTKRTSRPITKDAKTAANIVAALYGDADSYRTVDDRLGLLSRRKLHNVRFTLFASRARS